MTDTLDAILDELFNARDGYNSLADMYPPDDPRVMLARHRVEALKEKLQVVEPATTPSLDHMHRIREAFPMRRPFLTMYEHICARCGFIMACHNIVKMKEVSCPMCKMPTEWTDWEGYVKTKGKELKE
jgi:predicted Zn-ribbon and HTH transcriptional regulator